MLLASVLAQSLAALASGASLGPRPERGAARSSRVGRSPSRKPRLPTKFRSSRTRDPTSSPARCGPGWRDSRAGSGSGQLGYEEVNTIYNGVYPVINVTWGSKDGQPGQTFTSFIDTGTFRSSLPVPPTLLP